MLSYFEMPRRSEIKKKPYFYLFLEKIVEKCWKFEDSYGKVEEIFKNL